MQTDFPHVEQKYRWDCGAAALRMICRRFDVWPKTEEEIIKLLGSNAEDGTDIKMILRVAKQLGLLGTRFQDDETGSKLKAYMTAGIPVITPVQKYGSVLGTSGSGEQDGHYVVVHAYDGKNIRYEDPSDSTHHTLSLAAFLPIWHDHGADGKQYTRTGLAFTRMQTKQAVIGIPDRGDYGDLSQLQAGQMVNWIIQHHQARRAGPHYDMRLGTPDTGLFSWASRKEMPQPGKKILAIQQPLHSHEYGQFEGEIPEGYGAGTVKKHDEGRLLLTKVEPGKIHFTMAHRKYPERYVLVKTPKMGEDKWLLMNTTPTQLSDYGKIKYKTVPGEDVENVLQTIQPGTSVQEKIDGAASLNNLLKDKIEVLSHRQSKVTGGPIVHTERTFGTVPNIEVPRKYQGSVLRGELYGTREGKSVPVQELGGILNSSLGKSLDDQSARNIQMRNMVYDVAQVGKKPVMPDTPYEQRLNMVRDILGSITGPDAAKVQQTYHLPTEAKTPEDALKMWQDIKGGKNPRTDEGVVIHPPTGKPMKAKAFDEHDVFIRGMFPGKGKYEGKGIGGFVYSHEPKGPIAGEVGTGFDDALRAAMFTSPDDYVGRRARVQHTGKLPSGALFQPSLLALHEG